MGQQAAASETWRGQNKPTFQDSDETMGQPIRQRNVSHRAMEPDHVKNSKSRFETDRKIPSENERKPSDFAPYGMAVDRNLYRFVMNNALSYLDPYGLDLVSLPGPPPYQLVPQPLPILFPPPPIPPGQNIPPPCAPYPDCLNGPDKVGACMRRCMQKSGFGYVAAIGIGGTTI